MKGVVFTEFLALVESRHSPALLEDMIEEANLPSGGCYTAVGTYPAGEMISLLAVLSRRTGLSTGALQKLFGEYLFGRFAERFPASLQGARCAFDLLAVIESHIHKEVRKLHSDAELPTFLVECNTPSEFSMIYTSQRPLGDLCEGLIVGCLRHFGETAMMQRTDLEAAEGVRIRFRLSKDGAPPCR